MPIPLAITLAHARLTGDRVDHHGVAVPATPAEAYAVDDDVAGLAATPAIGWKIGATSAAAQEMLGVKSPISGRVYEGTVFESGRTLPGGLFHHQPMVECEIAVRTARALSPTGPPVDVRSARTLVASVHPAVELVGTRYDAGLDVPPALLIADGSVHAALVLGDPIAVEAAGDLAAASCQLLVDGQMVASGQGSAVLGDPYAAVAWLCNHLRQRHIELPAGSVITTGTMTGLSPTSPGQQLVNDAGPLGRVALHLP